MRRKAQRPPQEKRPRHYAFEIDELPRKQQAAALACVPELYRDWVAHYLEDWEAKRQAQRCEHKAQRCEHIANLRRPLARNKGTTGGE